SGGVADAQLLGPAGTALATASAPIAAGARTFRLMLAPNEPLAAGEYSVRIGARAGAAAIPSRTSLRITLRDAPVADGAIWIRRGPSTANRDRPTADLRFRRTETVRVEIPTVRETSGGARLLDRAGKPLSVPIVAAVRDDADGSRW